MPVAPNIPMRRKLAKPTGGRKPGSTKPTIAKENAPESDDSKVQESISPKFNKKVKLSAETLKKLFTSENPPEKVKKLKDLLRDRVRDGRRLSLKDWRVHAAIDEAYNAPFHQITPTLIGKILDGSGKMSAEEIGKEFARWGLSTETLFCDIPDPRDASKRIKVVNRETFHKVLVPIVKSVLNAREAKLFNERNNNPFFVYSPNRQTEEHKAVGDIITQMVEALVTQYGLKAVLRAAIHQALKYSFAMVFPAEAWHYEEDIDSNGKLYTRKEGMRYNIPHPTRTAWDQSCRPSTFNSDTGCEWALYWQARRFGDIDTNPVWYNKDQISHGSYWFGGAFDVYFEQVYPCVANHPARAAMSGGSPKDRETEAATRYTSSDYDKAVFTSDVFMKLSPLQWGLGEYKHKIWFRFVVCNDDTVVYAEPLPYCPVLYLGSDADDSTSNATASFALEATPWQDLVGNILSQHLLAVKQNCVKVIPYDQDQITEDKIREIEARSKQSTSIVWIPYSARDARVAQQDPANMFKPIVFPQTNTAEIVGTITQVFNIMERALGISAQEVGAIAGHIQTAEEIRTVSQNTSSRVEFTGTFIDEFVDAWKRQIYDASQAFMDEEFIVYIGGVRPAIIEKLKKDYGFEMGEPFQGKVEVKGKKSKLAVDAFLSTREGKTRLNQPQIAAVIMQGVQAVASSEFLSSRIDPGALIKLIDRAMKLAGAPEDATIEVDEAMTALVEMREVMKALQEASKEIATAAASMATKQATEKIAGEVGPAIEQVGEAAAAAGQGVQQTQEGLMALAEQTKQLQEAVGKITALFAAAEQAMQQPQMMPVGGAPAPMSMMG